MVVSAETLILFLCFPKKKDIQIQPKVLPYTSVVCMLYNYLGQVLNPFWPYVNVHATIPFWSLVGWMISGWMVLRLANRTTRERCAITISILRATDTTRLKIFSSVVRVLAITRSILRPAYRTWFHLPIMRPACVTFRHHTLNIVTVSIPGKS